MTLSVNHSIINAVKNIKNTKIQNMETTTLAKNAQNFTIKTAYIEEVKLHLNKISKKAKKVGVAEPKLIIGDEKLVKKYTQNFLLECGLSEPWFESYTEITVEWEDILIAGGWKFAATVEKLGESGNMVLGVAGLSDRLPTNLRTVALTCEHCKTKRNRKKHIVLVNDEADVKIVGSTCLKDFLGHDVDSKIAILEAEYKFLRSLGNEGNNWGQESMLEPPLRSVISVTFAILRHFPWVKSADSDIMNGKIPTYVDVQRQFFDRKLKKEDIILVEPQDIEKADQILEIWRTFAESANPATCSEWDWKKKLIVERESVEYKRFGLVVGLAYGEWTGIQRKLEQALSKPAASPSEFFGEVSKRGTFEITISRVTLVDGFRGSSEMIIGFEAGTNNKFVWFNSGYQDCYEQGKNYKVKATVKAHDTHATYGKQTYLTRVAEIG